MENIRFKTRVCPFECNDISNCIGLIIIGEALDVISKFRVSIFNSKEQTTNFAANSLQPFIEIDDARNQYSNDPYQWIYG